jgi:hypothetical protein
MPFRSVALRRAGRLWLAERQSVVYAGRQRRIGAYAGGTAGASGWQLIGNFPVDGASQVNSIVAQGSGVVAVGTIADDTATCIADTNNGHVWTTTDGITWVPGPADPLPRQT